MPMAASASVLSVAIAPSAARCRRAAASRVRRERTVAKARSGTTPAAASVSTGSRAKPTASMPASSTTAPNDLDERFGDELSDGVHVAGHPGDQIAVVVALVVAQREPLEVAYSATRRSWTTCSPARRMPVPRRTCRRPRPRRWRPRAGTDDDRGGSTPPPLSALGEQRSRTNLSGNGRASSATVTSRVPGQRPANAHRRPFVNGQSSRQQRMLTVGGARDRARANTWRARWAHVCSAATSARPAAPSARRRAGSAARLGDGGGERRGVTRRHEHAAASRAMSATPGRSAATVAEAGGEVLEQLQRREVVGRVRRVRGEPDLARSRAARALRAVGTAPGDRRRRRPRAARARARRRPRAAAGRRRPSSATRRRASRRRATGAATRRRRRAAGRRPASAAGKRAEVDGVRAAPAPGGRRASRA